MSDLSLPRRLRLYFSMVRYAKAHNRDFAREHWCFFSDLQTRFPDLAEKRVLDVGCGKSAWLTLLLHSVGAQVTGIDTEVVNSDPGPRKYVGIARENGAERALRTLVWDVFYARPYYRELAAVSPFAIRFEELDVRCKSATDLDFPDSTFDLIVSHEVFEHIRDIPATLRALNRVMKPDALTYIYIHNYTSLSGGHHIAWKYPDGEPSAVVPPWDHLRENRYPDIPSWINRMREDAYRHAFEAQFQILEWIHTQREGEALLTPEIKRELKDYSEEELLTKGFIVVAKPKAVH